MSANVERPRRSPRNASRGVVRDHIRLGLALLYGLAFAVLTVEVMEGKSLALDGAVFRTIAGWRSLWLISIMRYMTALGGMPWVPCLLGLLSVLIWNVYGLRLLLLWGGYTLGSEVLFLAIRLITHRPRPHSHAVAYPSGHTLAAVCLYGLLIYFLWPWQGVGRWPRRVACGGLIVIIGGVSLSRLILEIHWLSDILGAYLAGGFYLLICAGLFAGSSRHGRPKSSHCPLDSGPQPAVSGPVNHGDPDVSRPVKRFWCGVH
jgi:undecaprenyl-diphosphatase